MTSAAGLSAFMSNTAATAFFVPVTFGVARRAKISPSKLLMPLAFATILAGTITLIGTSTNLVVSGLLTQYKLAPMGMFELAPVGLPITIVGLIYMMTIGRRIIPDRFRPEEIDGSAQASVRAYSTEVLVQGATDDILKIKDTAGIDIKADVKLADPTVESEDTGTVEMILLPGSPLIGRTLKGQRFRERYGLQVLGVNRHGQTVHRKISVLPLLLGDVLLVQGPLPKTRRRETILPSGCSVTFPRAGRTQNARRSRSGSSLSCWHLRL